MWHQYLTMAQIHIERKHTQTPSKGTQTSSGLKSKSAYNKNPNNAIEFRYLSVFLVMHGASWTRWRMFSTVPNSSAVKALLKWGSATDVYGCLFKTETEINSMNVLLLLQGKMKISFKFSNKVKSYEKKRINQIIKIMQSAKLKRFKFLWVTF